MEELEREPDLLYTSATEPEAGRRVRGAAGSRSQAVKEEVLLSGKVGHFL